MDIELGKEDGTVVAEGTDDMRSSQSSVSADFNVALYFSFIFFGR